MRLAKALVFVVMSLTTFAHGDEPSKSNATPEEVVAGFERRVEAYFKAQAGHPIITPKVFSAPV